MSYNPGDELVDVIDAEGRTIAVVPRREMRRQRLPHRCVYVLVFNKVGQLFIHLRTATKDVYPSYWDLTIGGVLASGESFDEGVRREVREELGIDVETKPLFLSCYQDDRTAVQGMVYHAQHEGPFQLQPEEIVRGEFVSIAEIFERAKHEPICPDGLQVLGEYQRRYLAGSKH